MTAEDLEFHEDVINDAVSHLCASGVEDGIFFFRREGMDDRSFFLPFSFEIESREIRHFSSRHEAQKKFVELREKCIVDGNFFRTFVPESAQVHIRVLERRLRTTILQRNYERDQVMLVALRMIEMLGETLSIDAACNSIATTTGYNCRPAIITRRLLKYSDRNEPINVGHRIARELLTKNYPISLMVRGLRALAVPVPVLIDTSKNASLGGPSRELVVLEVPNISIGARNVAAIERFLEELVRLRESRFLRRVTDIQSKILSRTPTKPLGLEAFNEALAVIVREVFEVLLEHTPVSSATFRRLNCATNALELVVEVKRQGFPVDLWTGTKRQDPATGTSPRPIKIKRYERSVVAFTYCNRKVWADGVYLPDYPKVPGNFSSLGLKQALTLRSRTKSEWCLPIRIGQEAFGTINLESEIANAFSDTYRRYIQMLRIAIEEFVKSSQQEMDLEWLSIQGLTNLNIHELKQGLRGTFFNQKQKEFLETLVVKHEADASDQFVELCDLPKYIDDYIENAFAPENGTEIQQILEYRQLKCMEPISKSRFNTIARIIRNLLDNSIAYGDIRRDRIRIEPRYSEYVQPLKSKERSAPITWRVRYQTFGVIAEEVWDHFTTSPIRDEEEQLHFGMYYVGLAARFMDGAVFLNRGSAGEASMVDIHLPL